MQYLDVRGARLPALGLGTWLLHGSRCRRAVEQALGLGYRHIDTAQMYHNEDEVGAGLQAAPTDRAEVFVATKLHNGNHAPEDVIRSTERSLRDLRTEYVDLLLIHWPVHYGILPATLAAMGQLQESGKALHLGVSNFSVEQFGDAVRQTPILTNQVEYHPFLNQDALLDAARRHEATLTAYSPLAKGRISHDPTLQEIGRQHGKSPAQVALRWLLDQQGVAAIPKASSRDHLQANIEVFDFALRDEDRARIDGLGHQGLRVVPVD